MKVGISCPRADSVCEGRVRILLGKRVLATANYEIAGGRKATVSLKLGKAALKRLGKKGKKVSIRVFNRDRNGTSSSTVKKLKLRTR